MAISYVGEFGNNNSKTTGTTLAVSATASPQPAVGDLVVVTCGRDDIVSDPLTGDSLTDTHGNTWTRTATAGDLGTNGTGADGCNIITFYSVITVAWTGATTVTWTHPSVDARSMLVQHFAPTSGWVISLYGTPVNGSSSTATQAPLTAGTPSPAGDLVVGAAVFANAVATTVTGDSDTSGGSWSAVSTKAGTTGGTGNTNITCYTQHKIHTSPAAQVWDTTLGTASSCGNQLLSFHEMPATGIRLVGIGNQDASAVGGADPTIPPGAAAGDLLLMVVAARPTANSADGLTIAGGIDGWAQRGTTSYREIGADDLSVQIWWKIHDGSESAPSVTITHPLVGGFGCQIAAFRGVHPSTPFDVTSVNSDNAAAATWTPTGVSTATADAAALSVVASADDNTLDFNTSQSFRQALGGTASDSLAGVDFAAGLAYKIITSPGAVTMPTWNQSRSPSDPWAGISTALRPTGIVTEASAGQAAGTGAANNAVATVAVVAAAGQASGTGAANRPAATVNLSAGVAAGVGQAHNPQIANFVSVSASPGSAAGAAYQPTISASVSASVDAGLAAGIGSAPNATAGIGIAAGSAAGVGAAHDPQWSNSSSLTVGVASATGSAHQPTTGTSVNAVAGTAAAAGAANGATVTTGPTAGAAGGLALNAVTAIGTSADVAAGSGSAHNAAVSVSNPVGVATATGSGTVAAASVGVGVGVGTGSSAADDPTVVVSSAGSPLNPTSNVVVDSTVTWVVVEPSHTRVLMEVGP